MSQDAANWDRLQTLFHLAENTPEVDLDALLLSSESDGELRRRAKTLILAAKSGVPDAPQFSSPGHIGPYRVIRHLGTGGVGAVYLVERLVSGVIQRSALKIILIHATGSLFLERFTREQHILASLDHPNITRMLDAGLSDNSEPYLVMEYVDGLHLDVYCDGRKLDIPARLRLFLSLCEAIAYAHRNLIVHLDLKPSNILASEADGTVKVLDFGTSKLISSDGSLTTTVMATPAYASPEQLRNEVVTTSCDIYALGAILYELLAGRRPNFDRSISIMIERAICEKAPEPLKEAITEQAAECRGMTIARLRVLLGGDLATIAAKCLRPRPQDRYTNVDSLITDLRQYLAGRPVLARPQTTTYRIGKFIRRNRATVLAGALACAALLATAGYAVWRQEQAFRSGQRALQMQTFMSQLFKLANTSYMGKPAATVPEFLELGVKVLPEIIKDPADRRAGQLSLGESMYQNSDYKDAKTVLMQVISDAKAANDLASEAEAEAYAGRIAYQTGDPAAGKPLSSHALSLRNRAGVSPPVRVYIETFYASNQEDEGFRTDENINLLEAAVRESREKDVPENERAFAELMLADALGTRGRLSEKIALLQSARDIYGREPYAICDQSQLDQQLALIHNQSGDSAGSLALIQRAYEGAKQCDGPESRKALEVQAYVAAAMIRAGQAKASIQMLEAALPLWTKLVGPDSDDLATPLLFLARAYWSDGQFAKAEVTAANLVRVEQARINPLSAQMGVCQDAWAQALAGQHRYREALVHAILADKAFTAENSKAPGTQRNAAKAHKLLLDLQARIS
jgi:serine/threonine protein kinase/tetratricopeptide (TPR) repeat protein